MSRSLKKGPYVDPRIMKKVMTAKADSNNKAIKTWSRACTIAPEFIGHTFTVHNGREFIPVLVTQDMVGHKLGEFSPTRRFKGHPGLRKEESVPKKEA